MKGESKTDKMCFFPFANNGTTPAPQPVPKRLPMGPGVAFHVAVELGPDDVVLVPSIDIVGVAHGADQVHVVTLVEGVAARVDRHLGPGEEG